MKTQKRNMTTDRMATAGAAALALLVVCGTAANASLLIEDGFPAGGSSPAAGQYQSDPDSVTGANGGVADGDSILFQGPSGAVGFDAADVWDEMVGVGASVYPRVLDVGLDYTDGPGNTLNTTVGAVDWHRVAGGDNDKLATRATNLSTSTALPDPGYFSALIQFTSGRNGRVELHLQTRAFVFGFNTSGNVFAETVGAAAGGPATGTDVFAADTAHLIFGQINDGAPDSVSIWVNPADLSDPTAGTPSLASSSIGFPWVIGSGFTIDTLGLFSGTSAGGQFIFDEIRVGETAADVLPFTPIPEPSALAFMAVGMLCLVTRRLRRA